MVVSTLSVCQVAVDVKLDLVSKLLLHMLLDTTQHEWLQDHMQSPQLVFVELSVTLCVTLNVLGEPLAELVVRVEQARHDEMKKSPKFLHVVLDRCTRQQ